MAIMNKYIIMAHDNIFFSNCVILLILNIIIIETDILHKNSYYFWRIRLLALDNKFH